MAAHNELGKWGEETAAQLLRDKGYSIVERDWHSGHRDIDIIARTPDGATMVFVEVKTRSSDDVTRPTDAVDLKKIRNIAHAANHYVKSHNVDDWLRFDIVSIVGTPTAVKYIEHIEDAFRPLLAFR